MFGFCERTIHALIIHLVKLITVTETKWSDELDTPPFFGGELSPEHLGHWSSCKELNLISETFRKCLVFGSEFDWLEHGTAI
jgi:hypothetical protein